MIDPWKTAPGTRVYQEFNRWQRTPTRYYGTVVGVVPWYPHDRDSYRAKRLREVDVLVRWDTRSHDQRAHPDRLHLARSKRVKPPGYCCKRHRENWSPPL